MLSESYTAADIFPLKLLLYWNQAKKLRPLHLQWMPTNRCNLNCEVCSCSERDRNLEMPWDESIRGIIKRFVSLGTQAVTITGGGEPLCYPHIEALVECFARLGVQVALVTNGTLLNRLSTGTLNSLTWCRISSQDDRIWGPDYEDNLISSIEKAPVVDWAFSHVANLRPNLPLIRSLVGFAERHEFTHVRIVSNILRPNVGSIEKVRKYLEGSNYFNRVIFQDRASPKLCSECLIGYVKPVIAPDLRMYLCCGVQYALDPPSKDMPEELCMGQGHGGIDRTWCGKDPPPKPFKTRCVRCYYTAYNDALGIQGKDIKHARFV